MNNKIKLEKEVYIDSVNYHNLYVNNEVFRRNVSFSVLSNEISDEELILLKKMQENYRVKLTLEIEKPILDDVERKYLSNVVIPFRDRVRYINKEKFSDLQEHIAIYYDGDRIMMLSTFKKGTMYKGMELNRKYTLEELGL